MKSKRKQHTHRTGNHAADQPAQKRAKIKQEDDEIQELEEKPTTINPHQWNITYDHIIHLDQVETPLIFQAFSSTKSSRSLSAITDCIQSLLQKALGTRVHHIDLGFRQPTFPGSPLFPLSIGLVFSKHDYMENVEKGPEGDSVEAEPFRTFWGPECGLRRFPDGNIYEAVVWKCGSLMEKRMVCARIVKGILQRHAAVPAKFVKCVGNLWMDVLALQRIELPKEWPPYTSGEEYLQNLTTIYDTLTRDLRAIKDLSLSIVSIRSTSPSLRFAEPFPPLPVTFLSDTAHPADRRPLQPFIRTLPVQVVLEGSAKWPDDLAAIQRLKTAFQLQFAEHLKESGYTVVIPGVEGINVWKEGWCFKVEVVYLGELQLSRRVVLADGRVKLEDTELFKELRMKYELAPKLASALAGVARLNESFGVACRLAKRWITCQSLSGYLSEEAVELIMASIYLHPDPGQTCPVAPELGFIRFLHRLAHHNWRKNPLIVNFSEELKAADIEEIGKQFAEQRSENGGAVMWIVVPFERTSVWTIPYPSAIILKRLTLLAQSALKVAEGLRMTTAEADPKMLFNGKLIQDDWDVVIHLRPACVSRAHEHLPRQKPLHFPLIKYREKAKNPSSAPEITRIFLDFDTVSIYLDKLRSAYDHCAYFMADPTGNVVMVKWKKAAFGTREIDPREPDSLEKGLAVGGYSLGQGDGKKVVLVLDVAAVVEDFSVVGKGLVKSVEVLTDHWKI